MKVMNKKTTAVWILCFICTLLFSACNRLDYNEDSKSEDTSITLRLVVEEGEEGSSERYQTAEIEKQVNEYVKQTADAVKIEVEKIPASPDKREPFIDHLSVEIMAGDGPDIYLLPTKTVIFDPNSQPDMVFASLFRDVEQAMYGGRFLDISGYYDADTDLEKDNLNEGVMAGGCIDHSRYVLPMQYTVSTVLADTESLKKSGLDMQSVSTNIDDYLSAIAGLGNPNYASDLQGTLLNAFPMLFDYQNEKVLLEKGQLSGFFQNYQDFMELGVKSSAAFPPHVLQSYLETGKFWLNEETPFRNTILGGHVVNSVAVAKALNKEIAIIPLKASDGSFVANVTFWGAVGSTCKHPQEAYDFLRGFLSREMQFRPSFLGYNGWPVYQKGSVEALWKTSYYSLQGCNSQLEASLSGLELTDGDMPILAEKIDCVRYETALDDKFRYNFLNQLIDWNAGTSTNVDIEQLAADFLDEMRFHIQE